jgi:hypothetical protein
MFPAIFYSLWYRPGVGEKKKKVDASYRPPTASSVPVELLSAVRHSLMGWRGWLVFLLTFLITIPIAFILYLRYDEISTRKVLFIEDSRIEIGRATKGVVEIWAEDVVGMARGIGYAHALDRFLQMELGRLAGQGRMYSPDYEWTFEEIYIIYFSAFKKRVYAFFFFLTRRVLHRSPFQV